jgi:hypothetical protein
LEDGLSVEARAKPSFEIQMQQPREPVHSEGRTKKKECRNETARTKSVTTFSSSIIFPSAFPVSLVTPPAALFDEKTPSGFPGRGLSVPI